nr:aldo/keto reductase [Burkholderia cenocepacia]
MELHQLEAFSAVMSAGSVTGAGELLGRSQPAVTRQIQELEADLGYALFDRHGWSRYVANQVYYSLVGRDYEWDLMPLGADQGLGALVWSPLGWGRLTGKIRRNAPLPEGSRLHETASYGPPVDDARLYDVVDALDAIAEETGKTVPQIALNWLLQRPTVSSVIVGARNEEQLRQNLGAVGWALTDAQVAKLDAASAVEAPYPYFPYRRQAAFARLNPPMRG